LPPISNRRTQELSRYLLRLQNERLQLLPMERNRSEPPQQRRLGLFQEESPPSLL
jgi:hypothetical protein